MCMDNIKAETQGFFDHQPIEHGHDKHLKKSSPVPGTQKNSFHANPVHYLSLRTLTVTVPGENGDLIPMLNQCACFVVDPGIRVEAVAEQHEHTRCRSPIDRLEE